MRDESAEREKKQGREIDGEHREQKRLFLLADTFVILCLRRRIATL